MLQSVWDFPPPVCRRHAAAAVTTGPTPLFCLAMLCFWILLVRGGGQKLRRRRHLSWVAKPTEKISVDTTPAAPNFMPDVLSVATFPIYLSLGAARGYAGFSQ